MAKTCSAQLLLNSNFLRSRSSIHIILTKNVMNATFAFFDKTSFGEIVNHCSQDMQAVDQDLAVMAVATSHFPVALLGIITLIVIITPAFLVPGVFIGISYYMTGAVYVAGTRKIRQMEST
ncbi:uncharacterized protein BDZ99DRAFT_524928 [Mytilinidion resinicola]|uniref:ABC transmembrane type-1 domain-containing protein n=1 Tax=Mytilinidion resinicola TaxID=574789 RepID=A0A6A6Y8Q5_9PEZI|nr:uncharacterized protein BDZ99DRAFT_524928 [Mytilinidion resinicola]KAF2805216.1 hypothetical protein BDZ99DRAFT_524928 [Mytilinidion resinicola]